MSRAGTRQEEASPDSRSGGERQRRLGAAFSIRNSDTSVRISVRRARLDIFRSWRASWALRQLRQSGSTASSSLGRRESARAGARPAIRHGRLRGDEVVPRPPTALPSSGWTRTSSASASRPSCTTSSIPVSAGARSPEASLEVVPGQQARGVVPAARSPSSTRARSACWTAECPVTVAIAAVPTGKHWRTPTPASGSRSRRSASSTTARFRRGRRRAASTSTRRAR